MSHLFQTKMFQTKRCLPYFQVQQADGRWVLIGLVSAGFSCGKPGQPGIYHRISATSDWITKQAYNHLFF